jgi:hypothetical protein
MNKAVYSIFILFSFVSFGQEPTTKSVLNIDTSKIVIFQSIDTSFTNYTTPDWVYRYKVCRSFTLNNNDITIINSLLIKTVNKYNLSAPYSNWYEQDSLIKVRDTIKLNEDKRQYFPYIENKKRKVCVNSFCESDSILVKMGLNWKKEPMFTDGGGACFFYLIINLTDNKVEHFSVNAPL